MLLWDPYRGGRMYGRELESLRTICRDKTRFDMYLSDYRAAIHWAVGLSLALTLLCLLFTFLPFTGFCGLVAGFNTLEALKCTIALDVTGFLPIALAVCNIVIVPRFLARASDAVRQVRRIAAQELDRQTSETVRQNGPFVLYLRPFVLDATAPEIQLYVWSALQMHAPIVAIGNDPHSVIYQFQSSDEDWRDKFRDLARRSLAIVIVPFATPSTAWELEWIINEVPDKTIVLMPPTQRSNWFLLLTGTDLLSPDLTQIKSLSPKELWPTALAAGGTQLRMPEYSKRGGIYRLRRKAPNEQEADFKQGFSAQGLRDALLSVANNQGRGAAEPTSALLEKMASANAELKANTGKARRRRVAATIFGIAAVIGALLLTVIGSHHAREKHQAVERERQSRVAEVNLKFNRILDAYGALSMVLRGAQQDRRQAAKELVDRLGGLQRDWERFNSGEISAQEYAMALAMYVRKLPEWEFKIREASMTALREAEHIAERHSVPLVDIVTRAERALLDCGIAVLTSSSAAVNTVDKAALERATSALFVSGWRWERCAFIRESAWLNALKSAYEENAGQRDQWTRTDIAVFGLLEAYRSLRISVVEQAAAESNRAQLQESGRIVALAVDTVRDEVGRTRSFLRGSRPDLADTPGSGPYKLGIADKLLAAFDDLSGAADADTRAPAVLAVERQIEAYLASYYGD